MPADSIHCPTQTSRSPFQQDVLTGLSQGRGQKSIPSRYLYDERGCELFDAICETPEYYPTRTEIAIMQRDVRAMAAVCGPRCRLVELGSGSSVKTELLLDHLQDPVLYVPVDFAEEYLEPSVRRLRSRYPDLQVKPRCVDFSQPFELDGGEGAASTVVYFPGSTIGNFHRPQAVALLQRMRKLCGKQGGILIGMDLKKDPAILERAYNDRQGVTAQFTANLLRRMENELDARLNVDQFEHFARYNPGAGRIEIYLASSAHQTIQVAGREFGIAAGELINTEYSYKYSLDDVQQLAREASCSVTHAWLDQCNWFGVFFFA